MSRLIPRRALVLSVFLLAVAGFAGGVWWFAFTSALDQLDERGRADLSLASDRLTGQLQRFRELAVLLSDHPTLVPLVRGGPDTGAADDMLLAMADKTGSLALALVAGDGTILAASDGAAGNLTDASYVRRAMNGALGAFHAVQDGRRIFTFAAPVFAPGGPVQGAVIVRVDIATLEWNWPADPSPVFFVDRLGVVFVANRSELVLARRDPTAPLSDRSGAFTNVDLPGFPAFTSRNVGPHQLWSVDGGRYLPERALHLTLPLPVIGMTGEILLDLATVLRLANLQAAVAAALCLAFGALLAVAAQRRHVLAQRLQIEAAANAELEIRVAQRTAELSRANIDLRREIGERKDAEAALKRAQADLVQAGKLSALGQMSAGISHELNQPLMAIQGFAENGTLLLERGNTDAAWGNLGRISELARRMGRIIKNLRAFARQESVPMSDVDLVTVVEAALEITQPRLTRAGVTLDWVRPAGAVMVRGGEVRLQQVALNLISNAADAMQDGPDRRLRIRITPGDPVTLSVSDTGPGLDAPEKIFDPFYTTKEVGAAEGMGLGLSISYGLVQSFGGAIRGRNRPGGGAEFTVELAPALAEVAA